MEEPDFLVERLPPARRTLRVAVVAESYPPDTGEVAAATHRLVEGLRSRGHEIQLLRPRRPGFGLPATPSLARLWAGSRPDVVYALTQGPLGWSALRAARRLRLPVVSQFNPGFFPYARGVGAGWLSRPVLAYLRKFHNRTLWTLVTSDGLCAELRARGFRNLRVGASGSDSSPSWDLRRIETLLEVAASLGPGAYASGERRTRTPIPQST